MNKRNYQKELDKLIDNIKKEGRVPESFSTQLLCAVQQLRAGIFVSVF